MTYNLDQIPFVIDRNNYSRNNSRINNNVVCFSIVGAMFVVIVNEFVFHFSLTILFSLILFLIVIVSVCVYFGARNAPKISMTINDKAIAIDKNGYKRIYPWSDIVDVKMYSEPIIGRGKTTYIDYLDIWRRGELVHDIKAYCPREDFDIGANDLESLIRDGMGRWGGGDHPVN